MQRIRLPAACNQSRGQEGRTARVTITPAYSRQPYVTHLGPLSSQSKSRVVKEEAINLHAWRLIKTSSAEGESGHRAARSHREIHE